GRIEFVNRAWAGQHGWSVADLAGRSVSDFHDARQLQKELEPLKQRAWKRGSSASVIGHAKKTGVTFATLTQITVLRTAQGVPRAFLLATRERISEKNARRDVETELAVARVAAAAEDAVSGVPELLRA